MSSPNYKNTGIKRLLKYKEIFLPANLLSNTSTATKTPSFKGNELDDFINIFCEHQLADNDYMNIHLESNHQKNNISWLENLAEEKVLKLMTYIIWTDKFVEGYLTSRITDGTLHQLLNRLETLQTTAA
jgi:hypothetical protein